MGPTKESRKIPANFPAKFPCEIAKKLTDELLHERRVVKFSNLACAKDSGRGGDWVPGASCST